MDSKEIVTTSRAMVVIVIELVVKLVAVMDMHREMHDIFNVVMVNVQAVVANCAVFLEIAT